MVQQPAFGITSQGAAMTAKIARMEKDATAETRFFTSVGRPKPDEHLISYNGD